MPNQKPLSLSTILTLLGVLFILVGFFSPWIPHSAVGLTLTGFEIGEWIKFTPEVRTGESPLRRTDFYWPPTVAAIGLAMLAAGSNRWRWLNWALVVLAALLSFLPFPLLEEVKSLDGVKANWERLALVAMGLAAAGLVAYKRQVPARARGIVLMAAAGVGVVLVSRAFSTAEPIVERLFNHLIDPGLGYNLTRGGMVLLALASTIQLFNDSKTIQ